MKKVLLFPIRMIVKLLGLLMDLFIKAECLVAGIGFLFLAICLIYSMVKQLWLQAGIFVAIIVVAIVFVLMTAEIKVWLEILEKKLV